MDANSPAEQELNNGENYVDDIGQELENMHMSGSETDSLDTQQDAGDIATGLTFWLPVDHEPGQYWTHEPYRNAAGDAVSIHYCTDRTSSERIAKQFLRYPVVGFDMEWATFGAKGLKGNISLIQVACEDKIALFHIAVHQGRTVSDLICPSLRKLIENEHVLKCGVAINNADGSRLRRFMKLQPRGMFELSHLHKVVKWAKRDPSKVNKRLIKLTWLAEEHLGRPLFKGNVRTSDWTKRLSEEQIRYAAADAYSGFRIFCALEAKRRKQDPIPPRPAPAELGLPLLPTEEFEECDMDTPDISVNTPEGHAVNNDTAVAGHSSRPRGFKVPAIDFLACDDPSTRQTYSALGALRKRLSIKLNQPEQALVSDSTLFSLAEDRPKQATDLDHSAISWSQMMLEQAHIDLFEFLQKHRPVGKETAFEPVKSAEPSVLMRNDHSKENQSKNGITPLVAAESFSGNPDLYSAVSRTTSFDVDYTKYFSEDDFDDTDFSLED